MYALENTEGVPGTADGGASRNVIDMRSAPSPQKRLYPKTLTVFLDASPSGKHRAVHAAVHASRGSVQRPPTRRRARCRHRLAIGAAWCASQRGTRDVERLSDPGGDHRACRAERIGPARIWSLWSLSVAGTFARRHNANLARANACPRICFDITRRARIVEFSRNPRRSIGVAATSISASN
jgi:hypothetical protein